MLRPLHAMQGCGDAACLLRCRRQPPKAGVGAAPCTRVRAARHEERATTMQRMQVCYASTKLCSNNRTPRPGRVAESALPWPPPCLRPAFAAIAFIAAAFPGGSGRPGASSVISPVGSWPPPVPTWHTRGDHIIITPGHHHNSPKSQFLVIKSYDAPPPTSLSVPPKPACVPCRSTRALSWPRRNRACRGWGQSRAGAGTRGARGERREGAHMWSGCVGWGGHREEE